MRKELEEFDPLAELENNLKNHNSQEMDPNERKSVWKMNYHMKNDKKKEGDKINVVS